MHSPSFCLRVLAGRLGVAVLALGCSVLHPQAASRQVMVDEKTLQELLTRVDRLENRVKELEEERALAADGIAVVNHPEAVSVGIPQVQLGTVAGTTSPTAEPKPSHAALQVEDQEQSDGQMERMDVSKTLLRIRGFGDVSVHGDTQKGDTTSFSLGQLDLFVTSDISDTFRFLSEIVFEGGPDNIYGVQESEENSFSVDIERYLLQYSHNDYFNLSAGRGHTAIGYYNTAYHHSSWLQTTTGRPFLFEFEDRGGILPIHMVGVTASGQIPSGSLGLHYIAEVGNGRASRQPLQEEPVQNEIDDQNTKAFNLALFARPDAIHGLQTGFSYYHDLLSPANQPRIRESILAAHAVVIRPRWEWLNEALLDRHSVVGTNAVFNTPGFYSQLSRQFGSYRPYFRYEYLNVANGEPVFPDVALRHGPLLGLRYDPAEAVALKFEYGYTMLRNQPAINGLEMQVGFTF